MYKVILLVRRKAGLTREEFIDAYENRMVPIIEKHFASFMVDYRRDYVVADHPLNFSPAEAAQGTETQLPSGRSAETGTMPDRNGEFGKLDVVTELLFEDRETLERMFEIVNRPEISAEIAKEGHSFIDMPSAYRYITEVRPTDSA